MCFPVEMLHWKFSRSEVMGLKHALWFSSDCGVPYSMALSFTCLLSGYISLCFSHLPHLIFVLFQGNEYNIVLLNLCFSNYKRSQHYLWNALQTLCPFFDWVACLFLVTYRNALYILNIIPLLITWCTTIFSQARSMFMVH